ncbi:MAG: hypothetical protein IPL79_00130 [Myxococcales bacterium]|nr:hypothetical protein [Myxococcales bacterium]
MKHILLLIALSPLTSCLLEENLPIPTPGPAPQEPQDPEIDPADCYANLAELPAGPYVSMTMDYPHYCQTQSGNFWIGRDHANTVWLTNGNGGSVEGTYQYDAATYVFTFTSADGCLAISSHLYSIETSPGSATFGGTGTESVDCTVP